MAKKYCYLFSEGNANMRELLGGKGANLAEMTNIGLPVPQGFTITTEACTQYYEDGREINPEIMAEINEYIVKMEGITGKKFGDKTDGHDVCGTADFVKVHFVGAGAVYRRFGFGEHLPDGIGLFAGGS